MNTIFVLVNARGYGAPTLIVTVLVGCGLVIRNTETELYVAKVVPRHPANDYSD